MLPTLPAILGHGGGRTVVEVGEGVESGLLGTCSMASLTGTGGYAEYAAVDVGNLIGLSGTVPAITMQDAVALLADGRTAMLLAERADIQSDDTVLMQAAAGGVGSLLLQRARSVGAYAMDGGIQGAPTCAKLGWPRIEDVDEGCRKREWDGRR